MVRARLALGALLAVLVVVAALGVAACGSSGASGTGASGTGASADGGARERAVIVATTPILGAIVRDAVGDAADVRVLMPNGGDPHEWRPSAKDVAELQSADLVMQNGLGLEQGLQEAISQARDDGVPVFTATDHVAVRPGDPHFWTDPSQVAKVVAALPAAVRAATGADIAAPAAKAGKRLAALDAEIADDFAKVPETARNVVTGHESLGYLAARYGLALTGAVTPSLSSQGQVSAAHLKQLEDAMSRAGVRVVFTETGLPNAVADAIVAQAGATLVQLGTEALPDDGTYATYIRELARRMSSALANTGG
ncbi:MAG: metal ABC transporter substrate-binding protein [Acidobacteria bacterium]|nr:metal ABC transporter substrate-binding protein [Acidobacteriota bacterium]